MKKNFFWSIMMLMVMALPFFTACSKEEESIVNPTQNTDSGATSTEMKLTSENLAKYVTASISYDSDKSLYTANIQTSLMSSPLASKVQGKEIKYGMRVFIATNYTSSSYKNIEAFMLSINDSPNYAYATGTGNSYSVSVNNYPYLGMQGYDIIKNKTVWLDGVDYSTSTMREFIINLDAIADLEKRIEMGTADEIDLQVYNSLLASYSSTVDQNVDYTKGLYDYCSSVAQVFVEIEGERYTIKEKTDGPVLLMTYGDVNIGTYISGGTN